MIEIAEKCICYSLCKTFTKHLKQFVFQGKWIWIPVFKVWRMIKTTFRSVFDGKSKQDPGPDKFKSKFDKNWMLNLNRKPTRRRCEIFYNWNPVVTRFYVLISDVPDSLSGSGSGRILPFLSDIRIRPDLDMKKKSRSGSGRILTDIRPIRI